MFDTAHQPKVRSDIAKMIKVQSEINDYEDYDEDQLIRIRKMQKVIGAFIPIHFFSMMKYQKGDITQSEDDMINSFLTNLDSSHYENLFLVWNSDLKAQQQFKLKIECDRIMVAL